MQTIRFNPSHTYQQIHHFGASGAWSMDPIGEAWSDEGKSLLADLLFSQDRGIGLSAWRFNIGAGSCLTDTDVILESQAWRRAESFRTSPEASYDWSQHAGQQWFLRAAHARGVRQFIAFANSPPAWLTKNGHTQPDPTVGTTNLRDGAENAFAAYLADILVHFRDEVGVPFTCISPVNEPSWNWDFSQQEGNRYSIDDIRRVAQALHDKLAERRLDVEIDLPEAAEIPYLLNDAFVQKLLHRDRYVGHDNESKYGGKYREYLQEWMTDETMRRFSGNKVCGHSYFWDHWSASEDRLIEPRRLLRANVDAAAPGAVYWQTEYCILGPQGPGRDVGMDAALWTARVIHYDLTVANASAWNWWLAVSPYNYKDGLIFTDYAAAGDEETIIPTKTLWVFGQFSRFIRPGARRIDVQGVENDPCGLLVSAYVDDSNQQIIFVLVNMGERDEEIQVQPHDAELRRSYGSFIPFITSAAVGEDLHPHPAITCGEPFSVPARSVVTLVGRYSNISL